MKKIIVMIAAVAVTFGAAAQMKKPTEQMRQEFRTTVQKRDISKKHLQSNIPLAPAPKSNAKFQGGMPNASYWFPGEWEEVQAIVVTPDYDYAPATSQGSGYWAADPVVTGYADYFHYTSSGWQQQGGGPYTAQIDVSPTGHPAVAFYLMDAIQMGGAQAWVRIENADDSTIVKQTLASRGMRNDNMRFLIAPGNSIWYRDCGPICFYYGEGDTVGQLDFEYYPGRALDDSLPVYIERQFGIPNFTTMIEWEGGNCLVDGTGMVLSSDAIYGNNQDNTGQITWDGVNPNTINYSHKPSLTPAKVRDSLAALLGTRATHILPAFRYDGGTGHVDLYADMIDENQFVFSVMPDVYSNWVDYQTGMRNMDSLCSYQSYFGRNYYSTSIPFPGNNNGGNFTSQVQYNSSFTRTYSNHTFVNNLIIQPCFSPTDEKHMPTAAWDRANIEELKKAYPGYTIYCVDVRTFDGSGGAIHCITKQIPAEHPIRILHPAIHGNTGTTYTSSNAPIHTEITNVDGIQSAKVVFRVDGGAWNEVALTAGANNSYDATLPTTGITYTDHATVEYYISATSNAGKTITKPMTASQGGYFKFYVGNTVGIQTPAEENFGQFYPNPATDHADMLINLGDGGKYTVTIVDAAGRTVHTTSMQAEGTVVYTVNTARLAAGTYTVVFDGNGQRVPRRLVVK